MLWGANRYVNVSAKYATGMLWHLGNKKGLQNNATLCICCVFVVKTANAWLTVSCEHLLCNPQYASKI